MPTCLVWLMSNGSVVPIRCPILSILACILWRWISATRDFVNMLVSVCLYHESIAPRPEMRESQFFPIFLGLFFLCRPILFLACQCRPRAISRRYAARWDRYHGAAIGLMDRGSTPYVEEITRTRISKNNQKTIPTSPRR